MTDPRTIRLNLDRRWPHGTADTINEWVKRTLGFALEPWQLDILRRAETATNTHELDYAIHQQTDQDEGGQK